MSRHHCSSDAFTSVNFVKSKPGADPATQAATEIWRQTTEATRSRLCARSASALQPERWPFTSETPWLPIEDEVGTEVVSGGLTHGHHCKPGIESLSLPSPRPGLSTWATVDDRDKAVELDSGLQDVAGIWSICRGLHSAMSRRQTPCDRCLPALADYASHRVHDADSAAFATRSCEGTRLMSRQLAGMAGRLGRHTVNRLPLPAPR